MPLYTLQRKHWCRQHVLSSPENIFTNGSARSINNFHVGKEPGLKVYAVYTGLGGYNSLSF